MNKPSDHRLFHDPAGRQHPYQYAPFERQPYQPVAGQPVIIGTVSRPAGAFQKVWVEWRREGETTVHVSPGQLVGTEAEDAHWQMDLPNYLGGEHIVYSVCGQSAQGRESTQEHHFTVASWQRAAFTNEVTLDGPELRIEYALPGSTGTLPLFISFSENQLSYAWGYGSAQPQDALPPSLTKVAGGWQVEARAFMLCIGPEGRLEFSRNGEMPFLVECRPPEFLAGENSRLLKIRQSFTSHPSEAFYGFGERFNSLDQRGNIVDVRVYEQYKGQGLRTYIPIPFMLSSNGYGFYLESSRWSAFDLAASQPDCWSYEAELGECPALRGRLFTAPNMKENLQAYSQVTGKPVLPPDWAFGLWVSSNDWDSQAKVLEQLRLAQEHDIPADVLVIEAWSDEINFYTWNDSRYEPKPPEQPFQLEDFSFPPEGRWPDPKKMIDDLHEAGVRLMLWQIPVLKDPREPELTGQAQHDADERFMIENGFCARMPDGSPYRVRSPWFQGSLLMDFTSPAANDWWFGKRRYLVEEMGVDGFKTDGGEHLWGRETVFSDGRTGEEIWNEYPNLYQGAYTRFLRAHRGDDALLFSRSGYSGAQRFPAHWTGDENSTWEAYRSAVIAMQNAGLSGIPFISWDFAGFSGPLPGAELYLRAAAMAVFCPIMQYHSEYWRETPLRDRTPWNIQACTGDERVVPTFRAFVQLRRRLKPYILQEARKCAEDGLPLMRPLPLEYPDDPQVRQYPYQYLFGESLLVAPVVTPGITALKVYLPAGQWRDFWTDALYQGEQEVEVDCPIERIPVFIRGDMPFAGE